MLTRADSGEAPSKRARMAPSFVSLRFSNIIKAGEKTTSLPDSPNSVSNFSAAFLGVVANTKFGLFCPVQSGSQEVRDGTDTASEPTAVNMVSCHEFDYVNAMRKQLC